MAPRTFADATDDLGRDDVNGHADDEQIAEAGIEDELGRYARVGSPEDGRVRPLDSW